MPSKRRLVTSGFGTEKAGLLDFSNNKCALGKMLALAQLASPYVL